MPSHIRLCFILELHGLSWQTMVHVEEPHLIEAICCWHFARCIQLLGTCYKAKKQFATELYNGVCESKELSRPHGECSSASM